MLTVGLTGGIGSGKTLAGTYFENLGVPLLDADVISRELLTPGNPVFDQVITQFGTRFLNSHGLLDRRMLRQEIFSNKQKRLQLENIVHPAVRTRIINRLAELDHFAYVILIIPLLIETDFSALVNRVLVIDTSKENQITRVSQRDKQPRSAVEKIIASQLDREARLAAADDIISNEGTTSDLRAAVEAQHKIYLALANKE